MKIASLLPAAVVFALALIAFSVGCSKESDSPETASTTSTVTHVDAIAASQLLSSHPETVVLDVRTPEEFAAGHIAGKVVNVDFKAENFREEVAKLDRATPYLVHCQGGGRSTSTLAILNELGFEKVSHLDGGLSAWTESGETLVK